MDKINNICTKTQQYIQTLTSDGIIMSIVLAFLAIFLLKGFRLSKKEILRALLILCIVNFIILNMYLENNKRKEEEKSKFNYFLNMDGFGKKTPTQLPDITSSPQVGTVKREQSNQQIKSTSNPITDSSQPFMFQEGKTLII